MRPSQLSAEQIELWLKFQRATPAFGDPFLSPGFARVLDEVRSDVHVSVIDDGDEPVAFLAFQRGRSPFARPVGATISDAQAIVHHPEWVPDRSTILTATQSIRYGFDNLVDRQGDLANERGISRANWVVDLSAGWSGYLENRRAAGTSVLDDTRRDAVRMERHHGPVTFTAHRDDRKPLALLMHWKSSQFRASGAWDRFAQPWIRAAVERLVGGELPGCSAMLSTLSTENEIIAVHLGLRSDDRLVSWFPAYDRAFSKYGPGRQLLIRLLEQTVTSGPSAVWLGQGDDAYKQRFATGTQRVFEGAVAHPGLVHGRSMAQRLAVALRVDEIARRRIRRSRGAAPR